MKTGIAMLALLFSGCAAQEPKGKCMKWKTEAFETKECTRYPHQVCVDVIETMTTCAAYEEN